VILYRFGIFGGHHDFSMAARNDWLKLQNYYDVGCQGFLFDLHNQSPLLHVLSLSASFSSS
jgi:hypothetical protein